MKKLYFKLYKHLQRNVFALYSPRQLEIEPATFRKTDTEITAFYLQNQRDLLHQDLEVTELMKFIMENTVCG